MLAIFFLLYYIRQERMQIRILCSIQKKIFNELLKFTYIRIMTATMNRSNINSVLVGAFEETWFVYNLASSKLYNAELFEINDFIWLAFGIEPKFLALPTYDQDEKVVLLKMIRRNTMFDVTMLMIFWGLGECSIADALVFLSKGFLKENMSNTKMH